MMVLRDRLKFVGFRPSGFDYLRLWLAASVIAWHSISITHGEFGRQFWQGFSRGPGGMILPAFFALSGFLVAGSLARNTSLMRFLFLRILRIAPALWVETLLSAVILGILFSKMPVTSYVLDPMFWRYGLNMIGIVQFKLPGVFENNPSTLVNAQLWTLPFELECYLALLTLAFLGIIRRRWAFILVFLIAQAWLAWHAFQVVDRLDDHVTGRVLVMCFFSGVLIHNVSDWIPWNLWLFFFALAVSITLLYIPSGQYFMSLPAAYATIYIGMLNPPRIKFLVSGDYSYGIFLYGYPIQQALIASGINTGYWLTNLPIMLATASAFAAFSWWCVEYPALSFKNSSLGGIIK